jgi:hypothetical protein
MEGIAIHVEHPDSRVTWNERNRADTIERNGVGT